MSLRGRCVCFLLILTLSALLSSGCTTARLFTKPVAEAPYVTYPEWGPNINVAVIPFLNLAKDKDAGVKVRELFLSELYISGAFKDIVDEGEMYEVLKKLKVRETDPMGKDTIKTLGDNLGVQAIIFGTVEEYSERSAKGALFVVSLRMVDVETGTLLWLGNASREGGGTVGEALGLSDGPTVVEVARNTTGDLVGDLASVINKSRRKAKSKKPEDTAKKGDGQNNSTLSKVKGNAVPDAGQQAGANPVPAVKATSAGMAPAPALGGK